MKKSLFSRGIRRFREGVKKIGRACAAQVCGRRSFPFFGIPAGLATGIEDLKSKRLLYPPQPLSMQVPKTVDANLYWQFQAMLDGSMVLPEEGILTVNNGMATYKGSNLSSEGKLITTFLQPVDGKPPHQNDLFLFSTKRFFPRIYSA